MTYSPLKIKTLGSLETSETTHPTTQQHITDNLYILSKSCP